MYNKKDNGAEGGRVNMTVDLCEDVYKLLAKGITAKDISKYTNVSVAGVYRVNNVYKALVADDFDKALKLCAGKKDSAVLTWGLKKLNLKMPEERKELIVESDNLARIENKLDKIEGTLEKLLEFLDRWTTRVEERLDDTSQCIVKLANNECVNSDNLYKLMADFRNSVIMEMRKRR